MKKIYNLLIACLLVFVSGNQANAQGCSISATTGLHGYGCNDGDEFDAFELNGIAASNAGCSNNNYNLFTSPVWNLIIGQTYTWSATVGGQNQYDQGMAIWIDLNNDGFFDSSEQLANEAPALYHGNSFTIPSSATAGSNIRMRLRCDYYAYIGNTNQTACETYGSPNYNFYYGETEDYYVNLIAPVPCSGTPSANAAVTPTYAICPNTSAYVTLANSYTVMDMTYQWQSSTTSSLGGFSNVAGANNAAFNTAPLTGNIWYQCIITCSNSNQSITSVAAQVLVQNTTTNSVPYHENFEGIQSMNKLPNCSWTGNNLGTDAFTYTQPNTDGRIPRSGTKFASYYYYPSGPRDFYTNGIYLNAGVTYSASVWYRTEYYGYNNWTNLSILAGTSQTSTGQFTIATVGPAIGNVYKSLSNTFTVGTSGLYYVNVRATSNGNYGAYYLSWDDLSIIVPCELNQPQLNVTPNQTVCSGQPVTITAGGVDTYTWNTGSNSSVLNDVPLSNTSYTVVGTNTLTGCSTELTHLVQVFPTPEIGVFANKSSVCAGESAMLTAFGADQYIWSNNTSGNVTSVTPNATTQYTVFGSNIFGCQGKAVQTIVYNALPAVTATASTSQACEGDAVVLGASGASSYEWIAPNYYNTINPATIIFKAATSYTVKGKDANGCTGVSFVSVGSRECTGLSELTTAGGTRLYPNPNTGNFTVETSSKTNVIITDLTGRHVGGGEGTGSLEFNVSHLANGVYYVKVITENGIDVIKVVKE